MKWSSVHQLTSSGSGLSSKLINYAHGCRGALVSINTDDVSLLSGDFLIGLGCLLFSKMLDFNPFVHVVRRMFLLHSFAQHLIHTYVSVLASAQLVELQFNYNSESL